MHLSLVSQKMKIASMALLASLLSVPLSAQEVILPDSEMTVVEREAYKRRVTHLENERARLKPAYLQSAKLATERLGNQILKGDISYAIDNMYPRWKRIQVKLIGGEQKFIKKAHLAAQMMREDKTVITDFEVGEPKRLLYVNTQKRPNLAKVYYPVDFTFEKLVVVPTKMTVQFAKIDERTGRPTKVEKQSCQIAIYNDELKRWSFIDGSSISPNELRNLFPTMPIAFAKSLPKSGKVLDK